MKWLITGANGMVGSALATRLESAGEDVVRASHSDLDITSLAAVRDIVETTRPDAIVNCAAFTQVDDCESREEEATRVNGTAVGHLAGAANDALLVQISTDFVFDGAKRTPYVEEDPVAPLSAYGRSKLGGEVEAARAREHLIVRTSWVFGAGGANFV
ncbi:MAG TPA: NAD(P)-dependent oxidoreductase, partial [Thermoanaerobaculia bacterium]